MPAIGGASGAGCSTNNSQSNQCSSGIPYCCSPDGDGGEPIHLVVLQVLAC
jgi:hypothetical protein